MTLTLSDIQAARERIKPYIIETPVLRLQNLEEILGCEVYVKLENMQRTKAFKLRGVMNALLQLTDEELKRGVVTSSSETTVTRLLMLPKCLALKQLWQYLILRRRLNFKKLQSTGLKLFQQQSKNVLNCRSHSLKNTATH